MYTNDYFWYLELRNLELHRFSPQLVVFTTLIRSEPPPARGQRDAGALRVPRDVPVRTLHRHAQPGAARDHHGAGAGVPRACPGACARRAPRPQRRQGS
ncbi:hypothetical protein ON010_g14948 [Phytophthora cinnamomi]|nr:hypothetical protein ON010_g14948 [Phytophthora cinnamomi]